MAGIDDSKIPVLYSAGTKLAYRINKRYYGDVHYVWCTEFYHSKAQPLTSDPQSICNRLLQIVSTGDRHAVEIEGQKVGILKGADAKFKAGVITDLQRQLIFEMVNVATYSDFSPVLYIISGARVRDKCITVDTKTKASDSSVEYLITDLSKDDFQILDFKQVFRDMIDIPDRKAGD